MMQNQRFGAPFIAYFFPPEGASIVFSIHRRFADNRIVVRSGYATTCHAGRARPPLCVGQKTERRSLMGASEFKDYYEILEISPNANSGTVERMFRYFAQRYHPDNPDTGDRLRFDAIMEAHDTLRNPGKRAQHDIQRANQSEFRSKLGAEAGDRKGIQRDIDIQNKLLSILYIKRRRNVGDPGIGDYELELLLGCPAEHLDFHLWYLKEKGWMKRTEDGMFEITVAGVDQVNSQYERKTHEELRIEPPVHVGE
jgi:curved DNA-binding protein CbpA